MTIEPDPGTWGAALPGDDWTTRYDLAPELEQLGYDSVWVAGGAIDRLDRLTDVRDRTSRIPVVPSIIPADVYPAEEIVAFAGGKGDRVLLGLGGAHGPNPVATITGILDALDAAGHPPDGRMLAALGPRMVDLAAERTAGAITMLADASFVASTRARLGPGPRLAVNQFAAVGGQAGSARPSRPSASSPACPPTADTCTASAGRTSTSTVATRPWYGRSCRPRTIRPRSCRRCTRFRRRAPITSS